MFANRIFEVTGGLGQESRGQPIISFSAFAICPAIFIANPFQQAIYQAAFEQARDAGARLSPRSPISFSQN
jgi:hypothetical protein